MDEQQYRSAYREMNPTRCYFEKTLLLRYANCKQANKLFLAEREAFGCQSAEAQTQCLNLLLLLRDNARFSLQLPNIEGQLPHAKEIKVQVGGVFGIQQLLNDKNLTQTEVLQDDDAKFGEQAKQHAPIENIYQTIQDALIEFGSLDNIPYNEIVKSIINFKIPERKRKKKKR